MAYLHWIHSTRVNSCSEERDVVLHLPQGQRRGPTAAGHQNVEIASLESGADSGLSLLDVSLVTGRLCGFKVLGGCYRYSSSKAWCRAMRSEWLETLQKGMACCKGADNVVRTENISSTGLERLLWQSTMLPTPLYSVPWKLPVKVSTSHLFKTQIQT